MKGMKTTLRYDAAQGFLCSQCGLLFLKISTPLKSTDPLNLLTRAQGKAMESRSNFEIDSP